MSGIARRLRMAGSGLATAADPGLYLFRTITGENDAWLQFTDDISAYANTSNARLVFEYQNGDTEFNSFLGDIQLDAVNFDGTFYSFEDTGHAWENSENGETSYNSVSWQTLTDYATGGLRWIVGSGGTGSGGTGRTDAADGSYYVYAETSAPTDYGSYFWLRSPTKPLGSSPTLSYSVARLGSNIGTLKVYLEVL